MKEEIYRLYSPSVKLDSLGEPREIYELLSNSDIKQALKKANENYYHWEELRFKDWIPERFFTNKESFWPLVKMSRVFSSRSTPIKDATGNFYRINTDYYNEFLHILDKEMAGNFMGITAFSESDKKRFIARNLIEESIASSQLEGANTSRTVAKRMLIEGRKPRDYSEKMIINNYNTMRKIEQELFKEKLSWDLLCELHRLITYGTILESKQGVLRETLDEKGNKLVIRPWRNGKIAYYTPAREFVEAELPRLIDFANDVEAEEKEFIHPLIKGIMLHFWIGLLHPFEDGNGRLARILFYWYMLRKEYWAFAYLSLSEQIKKSANQYAMAYLYSEQDDYDLTYFVNYNFEKLKLARKEFQIYIENKRGENRLMLTLNRKEYGFNDRQIKLLQYLSQKAEEYTSTSIHQNLYSIGRATASKDLNELVKLGFLVPYRKGNSIFYYSTEKIQEIFKYA